MKILRQVLINGRPAVEVSRKVGWPAGCTEKGYFSPLTKRPVEVFGRPRVGQWSDKFIKPTWRDNITENTDSETFITADDIQAWEDPSTKYILQAEIVRYGEKIMTEQEKEQKLKVYTIHDFYVDEAGEKFPVYLASRSVNSAAKALGMSRYTFNRRAVSIDKTADSEILETALAYPNVPLVELDGFVELSAIDSSFKSRLFSNDEPKPAKKKPEQPKEKGSLNVDIKRCARCSKDHNQLAFSEFKSPILEVSENEAELKWTHWALCPTYQEPVLLRIVVVSE